MKDRSGSRPQETKIPRIGTKRINNQNSNKSMYKYVKHNLNIESPQSSTEEELYQNPVNLKYKRIMGSKRVEREVPSEINLNKLTNAIVTLLKDPHNDKDSEKCEMSTQTLLNGKFIILYSSH